MERGGREEKEGEGGERETGTKISAANFILAGRRIAQSFISSLLSSSLREREGGKGCANTDDFNDIEALT